MTATTRGRQAPRVGSAITAGLDLLRSSAALLRHHWLALVLIALTAYLAQYYLMSVVIRVARAGAVPGLLTLSLVPFISLLAVVGMLLVLRRRSGHTSTPGDVLAALAAVLVPYLVVYQSGGGLMDDMRVYVSRGFADDASRTADPSQWDTVSRLPVAESAVVLGVVFTAVAVRLVGVRMVRTSSLWRGSADRRRTLLQIVVGYAEVVWIVLGAYVVTYLVSEFTGWWTGRQAAQWLRDLSTWIEGFWPAFGWVAPAVWEYARTGVAGAITAIVVPVSWLAIGVIVYGSRASDLVTDSDLLLLRRTSPRFARLVAKVGMAPIVRAWRLLTAPDGRLGALTGAGAMILKSGWTPVLTFCLAYMGIAQLPYLVWAVLGRVAPTISRGGWDGLHAPVTLLIDTTVLVVSVALLAAAADALLVKFGAPTWLRLPSRARERPSPPATAGSAD